MFTPSIIHIIINTSHHSHAQMASRQGTTYGCSIRTFQPHGSTRSIHRFLSSPQTNHVSFNKTTPSFCPTTTQVIQRMSGTPTLVTSQIPLIRRMKLNFDSSMCYPAKLFQPSLQMSTPTRTLPQLALHSYPFPVPIKNVKSTITLTVE